MAHARTRSLLPLSVGALGVVFGDIGTSPLYVFKAVFFSAESAARSAANVLGATSLVFWSLAVVVAAKYICFILRADQNGEGGIFALLSLLRAREGEEGRRLLGMGALTTLIMVGAALLFGDGIITPSISVLSACEGLEVATSALRPAVIPATIACLVALFLFQSRGTTRVGRVFGPIMIAWFLVIAAAGLPWIARHPEILGAVDPRRGAAFLVAQKWRAVFVIGAVVLCVTGGEALYADLGHFGARAIRASWFSIVYPSLLVNYFGQGARLLDEAPIPNGHVFYAIFPQAPWVFYPAVALATLATIIASQALISGAFSLARQAMALGYFPRLRTIFTSASMEGQIYLPGVNWALLVGCVVLVLGFRSSNALAAAYGIAVTGTMAVTTLAFYAVARGWGWRRAWLAPLCAVFLGVDLSFFLANLWKFADGGYVPIVIAAALLFLMETWRWGRGVIAGAYRAFATVPIRHYVELKRVVQESPRLRAKYGQREVAQVERAVVFLSSRQIETLDDPCPVGLRVYIRRNGAIPKHVVILHVAQLSVPYVDDEERYSVIPLGSGVVAVGARWGYMQAPDVPSLLRELRRAGLIRINESRWTIQSGEEAIVPEPALSWLQHRALIVFQQLLHLSTPADRYFGLREYAGRNKIVVPVIVGRDGARVAISDEEVG
jgi:KUP system potassium uptake protein